MFQFSRAVRVCKPERQAANGSRQSQPGSWTWTPTAIPIWFRLQTWTWSSRIPAFSVCWKRVSADNLFCRFISFSDCNLILAFKCVWKTYFPGSSFGHYSSVLWKMRVGVTAIFRWIPQDFHTLRVTHVRRHVSAAVCLSVGSPLQISQFSPWSKPSPLMDEPPLRLQSSIVYHIENRLAKTCPHMYKCALDADKWH